MTGLRADQINDSVEQAAKIKLRWAGYNEM